MFNKKNRGYALIKRRGNFRYFVRFFLFVSTIGIISFFGYNQLQKMDYFNVRKIIIKGNQNVPNQYIYEFVKKYKGINIFKCKRYKIADDLSGIVRIKSVSVSKKLPSTLVITINENKAKFILKTRDGFLIPVSKNNIILDNAEFYIDDNAPIIDVSTSLDSIKVGSVYQDSLFEKIKKIHKKMFEVQNMIVNRISEYSLTKDNNLIFTLDNGVKVIPDTSQVKETLDKLTFALLNSYVKKYQTIDLRYSEIGVITSEEK